MSNFDPSRFRDIFVFGGQGNTDGITPGSMAGFATGALVFSVLKMDMLPVACFTGGPMENISVWLQSQAGNPFACATLGGGASILAMVLVSLVTSPPSEEHLQRVFGTSG